MRRTITPDSQTRGTYCVERRSHRLVPQFGRGDAVHHHLDQLLAPDSMRSISRSAVLAARDPIQAVLHVAEAAS